MHFRVLIFLLFFILIFSDSFSNNPLATPERTLRLAFDALENDDVQLFKQILTPNLATFFGKKNRAYRKIRDLTLKYPYYTLFIQPEFEPQKQQSYDAQIILYDQQQNKKKIKMLISCDIDPNKPKCSITLIDIWS